ncbi:MAG: hypothetical protein ACLSUW_00830 [Akkermansia sp.]
MAEGDERARKIYETIGVHFGYAIAHYARFYDIRNLLFLGRVASGDGGQIIIDKAEEVLRTEFPELKIQLRVPDEKTKRHGQAVAAASLPALSLTGLIKCGRAPAGALPAHIRRGRTIRAIFPPSFF